MKIHVQSKAFIVGFFTGLFLFIVINVYSYSRMQEQECFDCLLGFGFPFHLYESGTILHLERTLWLGLIVDFLIAICASILIGLVCHIYRNRSERSVP
jgi:hypothetical protein